MDEEQKKKKYQEMLKLMGRETYGFPSNKTIYDAEGRELKVGILGKRIVPPFGEKSFTKILDVELRDDDVILCGYPKTGCHWTWEILSMISQGTAQYSKMGKGAGFMEIVPVQMMDSIPSPRILNTHVWFDMLPKQIKEKKTKLVFTVRNPKDTAVSFYNHHMALKEMQMYDGPFTSWFPLYITGQVDYGSYFDYHVDWDTAIKENPDQPILIVSFEDMKEDLPREIRKMAKFLEKELSEAQVEEIAKAAGFDAMKKAYNQTGTVSSTLLRKGQVGDWKNWLTVAMDEQVDAVVKEKLTGTRFDKFRYTL